MRSCCAVYVDVGYLLAAAATRVTGSSLRRGIQADYASLIEWLVTHAEADSGLPLLRVNWYDAGGRPGGMPDASQDEIGQLAGVKLRLGRLSYSGEQKGVDVRIGLDLAIQARQRVADVVYLVSGDDDLTEAVEDAQSHGVQVVLLAVPRHDEKPLAVSKHLLREVDRTQVIAQDVIDSAFRPTAIPEVLLPSSSSDDAEESEDSVKGASTDATASTGAEPLAEGAADEALATRRDITASEAAPTSHPPVPGPPRLRRRTVRVHDGTEDAPEQPRTDATPDASEPHPQPGAVPSPAMFARRKADSVALPEVSALDVPRPPEGELTLEVIDAVARQVVAAWCTSATPDLLSTLRSAAPVIPSELDRALLVDLVARSDHDDLDDTTRHRVRARFWHHISRVRPV